MTARRERLLVCGIGAGMDRSLADVARLGVELVVLTEKVTGRVRDAASEIVVADARNPDAAVAATRAAGIDRIAGVLSLGCDSAPAVARLSRLFGCPGLSEEVALDCTRKDRRLRVLAAGGLPVPAHGVAAGVDEALAELERIGLPAVVKPVDQTSSIGVAKLDSAATAPARVSGALAASPARRVLVERFLTGTEHTVAGLAFDGEVRFSGFSDREYGRKEEFAPAFFEEGDTLPTALDRHRVEIVLETVERGVRLLGLDGGAVFNTDVLVTSAGEVVLLEVACRLTGARIATEVVPLATGVNVLSNAVRLALGREIRLEELRPTADRAAVQRYLPATGGRVRRVGRIETPAAETGVYDVFWGLEPVVGQTLPTYRSADDVLAGAIATGASVAEADAAARDALARIPLEVEPERRD